MNKAYKFRIDPNCKHRTMLAKTFGCVRFIYNHMLSDKIKHYEETRQRLNNTPAQYKKELRKLSKMEKISNNRNKQRIKVAKLHEKVADQRKEFLHKQSRQITNVYDCICIENLDMKAMAQSRKYGKSVADNGGGMFVRFIKYKLEEKGKRLVKADKFFASSQICNLCGNKNPDTKKFSVRRWDCPECGTHHDGDVNTAINIRKEGMFMAA